MQLFEEEELSGGSTASVSVEALISLCTGLRSDKTAKGNHYADDTLLVCWLSVLHSWIDAVSRRWLIIKDDPPERKLPQRKAEFPLLPGIKGRKKKQTTTTPPPGICVPVCAFVCVDVLRVYFQRAGESWEEGEEETRVWPLW